MAIAYFTEPAGVLSLSPIERLVVDAVALRQAQTGEGAPVHFILLYVKARTVAPARWVLGVGTLGAVLERLVDRGVLGYVALDLDERRWWIRRRYTVARPA